MNRTEEDEWDKIAAGKDNEKQAGEARYYPEYRIYKPKKSGDGCATRLQIRHGDKQGRPIILLFLESAQQTGTDSKGNASFGWKDKDKKIIFKLEAVDIGDLLAVLNGVKQYAGGPAKDGKGGAGLFHQNKAGNTVMKFERAAEGNLYWFGLSAKRDGKLLSIKHMVTLGEAEILRLLFQEAIKMMFQWR